MCVCVSHPLCLLVSVISGDPEKNTHPSPNSTNLPLSHCNTHQQRSMDMCQFAPLPVTEARVTRCTSAFMFLLPPPSQISQLNVWSGIYTVITRARTKCASNRITWVRFNWSSSGCCCYCCSLVAARMSKRRREPEVIVFEEPKFTKRKSEQEICRVSRNSMRCVESIL